METIPLPQDAEKAVLAVLGGTPLATSAARIGIQPSDLADAVQVYCEAGRSALRNQAPGWQHLNIEFCNWATAEHTVATHIGPALQQAQANGTLAAWWFLRKHPCWRLRYRATPTTTANEATAALTSVLDALTATGRVQRWWESHYEPEILAFGGPAGIGPAHHLFHADSAGILSYLRNNDPEQVAHRRVGRREVAVLWCTTLLRNARLDRHEQGDVWHRVCQMRPRPSGTVTPQATASQLRRLLSVDTSPTSPLFEATGPLWYAASWFTAAGTTGRHLATAGHNGTLDRGLRAILAHHVIFHLNRIGLSAHVQAALSHTARDVLMTPLSPIAQD